MLKEPSEEEELVLPHINTDHGDGSEKETEQDGEEKVDCGRLFTRTETSSLVLLRFSVGTNRKQRI